MFLNLLPEEMKAGDIWDEGQEIFLLLKNECSATWGIHFLAKGRNNCDEIGCILDWPDNAPKRIMRINERVAASSEAN